MSKDIEAFEAIAACRREPFSKSAILMQVTYCIPSEQ